MEERVPKQLKLELGGAEPEIEKQQQHLDELDLDAAILQQVAKESRAMSENIQFKSDEVGNETLPPNLLSGASSSSSTANVVPIDLDDITDDVSVLTSMGF